MGFGGSDWSSRLSSTAIRWVDAPPPNTTFGSLASVALRPASETLTRLKVTTRMLARLATSTGGQVSRDGTDKYAVPSLKEGGSGLIFLRPRRILDDIYDARS